MQLINIRSTKLSADDFTKFVDFICEDQTKSPRQVSADFLKRFVDFYCYAPNTVTPLKNQTSPEMQHAFNLTDITDIRDSLHQARKDLLSQLLNMFWVKVERRFSTLQQTFRFFDVSQDNEIQFDEFDSACDKLGLRFTKQEKVMLFRRIDSDQDGQFTYDDFVRCAGEKKSRASAPSRSVTPYARKSSLSARGETRSDPMEEELERRREMLAKLKEKALFAQSKQDRLFDIQQTTASLKL